MYIVRFKKAILLKPLEQTPVTVNLLKASTFYYVPIYIGMSL